MSRLEIVLSDLAGFLDDAGVAYMVIGGFANLHWGKPRLTQDIDVTVQVPDAKVPGFLAALGDRYELLAPSPLDFARQTRVIPVQAPAGIRVDVILAGMPYEEEAIRRAAAIPIEGRTVRLCTAEDLIIHKLVSERPRDAEDVKGVILRQHSVLDLEYLNPLVDQITTALERPEITTFYQECLKKAGITEK